MSSLVLRMNDLKYGITFEQQAMRSVLCPPWFDLISYHLIDYE